MSKESSSEEFEDAAASFTTRSRKKSSKKKTAQRKKKKKTHLGVEKKKKEVRVKKKVRKKRTKKMPKQPQPSHHDEDEWQEWDEWDASTEREDIEEGEEEKISRPSKQKRKRAHRSAARDKNRRLGKKKARREKDHHIQEGLAAIYKNSDGSLPDMTSFEPQARFRLFRAFFLFLLSLLCLGSVAVVIFFFFPLTQDFSKEDVIISVDMPETVPVGESLRYTLSYENTQDIALLDTVLHLRYPKGFVFETSSVRAENETNDEWQLGTLAPKEKGSIEIVGQYFGDINEEASLRSFLQYKPENFQSTFQTAQSADIRAVAQAMKIVLDGPTSIGQGKGFALDIGFEEDDAQVWPDRLALEIELPEGIRIEQSSIEEDPTLPGRWLFDQSDLDATSGTIRFAFASAADIETSAVSFPIVLFAWPETKEADGFSATEPYIYAQTLYEATVVEEVLMLDVRMNGGYQNFTVLPGEMIDVSLTLRNNGDVSMDNIVIESWFDAPSLDRKSMLDWNNIEVEEDVTSIIGLQLSDIARRGTITWTEEDWDALATLAPGEERMVNFRLPLKNASQTDLSGFSSSSILFETQVLYTEAGEEKSYAIEPRILTIGSDFLVRVTHQQGEYILDVPVPLDGFASTTHRVIWTLRNNFHTIENLRLEADVYGDTALRDAEALAVPLGTIAYDAEQQKLVWSIESLDPLEEDISFSFVLDRAEDNPSQTQLMSGLTVQGFDPVIDQSLTRQQPAIAL